MNFFNLILCPCTQAGPSAPYFVSTLQTFVLPCQNILLREHWDPVALWVDLHWTSSLKSTQILTVWVLKDTQAEIKRPKSQNRRQCLCLDVPRPDLSWWIWDILTIQFRPVCPGTFLKEISQVHIGILSSQFISIFLLAKYQDSPYGCKETNSVPPSST